jgi:4-aminobutyrate aminotransferase-like enzyme
LAGHSGQGGGDSCKFASMQVVAGPVESVLPAEARASPSPKCHSTRARVVWRNQWHVREMVASGRPPAAFLCEPYYGNAGGMALPAGYLAAIYDGVREAGGLWVVPDVVTVAKAMGNGHPLGAVITTKEIAAGYRSPGYFFSSAGGSRSAAPPA